MKVQPIASPRVILEACPPSLQDRDKAYAMLRNSLACYNSFHGISVPDLQDGNEFHRKRERVPNEEFAAWLRGQTDKPLSLYKVVVTCTADEFSRWLDGTRELGCQDVILVGGDRSNKQHKKGALDVGSACAIATAKGFRCGGIVIPTRRERFVKRPASMDEAARMIAKVRDHGMRHFTSQVLYESEWMSCLLLDVVRNVEPEEYPTIFLTFSPFVCEEDIDFARKTLGVYIPSDVRRMLLGARSMREAAISTLLLVWERLSTFAAALGYPRDKLGVNVEYIDSRNPRNVDAAFELAEEFGRQLRPR